MVRIQDLPARYSGTQLRAMREKKGLNQTTAGAYLGLAGGIRVQQVRVSEIENERGHGQMIPEWRMALYVLFLGFHPRFELVSRDGPMPLEPVRCPMSTVELEVLLKSHGLRVEDMLSACGYNGKPPLWYQRMRSGRIDQMRVELALLNLNMHPAYRVIDRVSNTQETINDEVLDNQKKEVQNSSYAV